MTDQAPDEEEEEAALSIVAKKVLEDIFLVFNFLFKDDMKHKDDYRVALEKEKTWKKSDRVSLSVKFDCYEIATAFFFLLCDHWLLFNERCHTIIHISFKV